MAERTEDQGNYVAGRTLGRSGYVTSVEDQLALNVGHLDALLCFITGEDDVKGELTGFWNIDNHIQRTVLHLASRLATEIHEDHEELLRRRLRGQVCECAMLKEGLAA